MEWFTIGLLLASSAMATTLPVQDQDFGCIDASRARAYVRNFGIDVDSFGGLELCNPAVDSKKLFDDLQIIEEGRFNGDHPNLFIRNLVPRDQYLNWMQGETRGIARGNDVPYATAYNAGGYFTMQDGWAKLTTLGRVGTVLHEARHSEGYSHVPCDHGPYKDTDVSGCDTAVDAQGAHAVEMEYYARVVVQGANFHPVYQSMARLMLLARANFVFNANPLNAQDVLLARTDTGLARFQNGQRQNFVWEGAGPGPNAVMKRTSFGAAMFTLPGVTDAITTNPGEPATLTPDQYSYFKLLAQRPVADLRDFEEFDLGPQRYVTAVDVKSSMYTYTFGRGEWSPGHPLDGAVRFVTTDPAGHDGIFALLANGTYCTLNPTRLECNGQPANWPPQARNFVSYRDQVLRLDTLGKVTNPDGSAWEGLNQEHVLDLIKIPGYDAFETNLIY